MSNNQMLFTILQHTYWNRKKAFQLHEDLYKEWVVFAVEEGKFSFELGNESGEASFGDVVFCPPNTPFKRRMISPLTFHFIRFKCIHEEMLTVGKITLNDHNRLYSSYSLLKSLHLAPEEQTDPWKGHILNDIWQLYCMESFTNSFPRKDKKWVDPLMNEAQLYIDKHAHKETLQLNRVATHLGLSPVQFTRRFQAYYHITPSDYLTSLRIKKAKVLLLETYETIDHIADQCGYKNGFYLSRRFSEKVGISPAQYRKANQI